MGERRWYIGNEETIYDRDMDTKETTEGGRQEKRDKQVSSLYDSLSLLSQASLFSGRQIVLAGKYSSVLDHSRLKM